MANTGELTDRATTDAYADAEIYREQPEAVGAFVQVYNAAVYYELADELLTWQPERFLGPFVGTIGERCHGIRFRSAAAGVPARVTAHLIDPDEVGITGAAPNVNVAAGGTVAPIGGAGDMLTGIVDGDGTILAGTGFGVTRSGTGVYVIDYQQPYATEPVVLALVRSSSAAAFVDSGAASGASATVVIRDGAGNPADAEFSFVVVPVH